MVIDVIHQFHGDERFPVASGFRVGIETAVMERERVRAHQNHFLRGAGFDAFLQSRHIREPDPLCGVQTIAMQCVHHRISASDFSAITGRQINENIAVGRVALQIAFERFAVNHNPLQLALEILLQIGKRLDEAVALETELC